MKAGSEAKQVGPNRSPETTKATALRRPAFASRPELLERLAIDSATLTRARKVFPVQWPSDYLALVGEHPHQDPIARMGRPSEAEFQLDAGDLMDANGDQRMRPLANIVRKHEDRLIVLVTKRCHFYCRFCFRREEPPSKMTELNDDDWQPILDYIGRETDLREVILSGGDPLTLENARLFWIKTQLEAVPHLQRWRIHSRAPVHFPQRVDEKLIAGLAGGLPLRWVTHFNHAREITDETLRQARLMARFQIPFLNQSVLLRGVNATIRAQLDLWRGIIQSGIQPYYLHHPDRVPGNAHFRLSLEQGLSIFSQLSTHLDDQKPRYVLDLPDGSGKVAVAKMERLTPGKYCYKHADGRISHYTDVCPEP